MRQKIVMTKSRLNLEEKYGETLERCRKPCYSYILLVISGRGGLQLLIYNWEIGKGMELTCKDGSCRRNHSRFQASSSPITGIQIWSFGNVNSDCKQNCDRYNRKAAG